MDPYLVKTKEFACLMDFVIVNMDMVDPLVQIVGSILLIFNFITLNYYNLVLKIKVAIRRGTGHVLMGEHVVPMELVFVKLDLMDQIVNLVYSIIQPLFTD